MTRPATDRVYEGSIPSGGTEEDIIHYDIHKYNGKFYMLEEVNQDILDTSGKTADIILREIDINTKKVISNTVILYTSDVDRCLKSECVRVGWLHMGITEIHI